MPNTTTPSETSALLIERDGPLTWIVLNRPERLNAISQRMAIELVEILESLAEDAETHVIGIRGAGDNFCAGFDIAPDEDAVGGSDKRGPLQDHARLRKNIERLFTIWDHPKPIIAAVQGYCLAGGTQLATLCDLTVIAEDAKVGVSSLPIGGGYIAPMWVPLIGAKRAKQVSFQPGLQVSGAQMADWGWANYAVPQTELIADVTALAKRIARTPQGTLSMKKLAINRLGDLQGYRQTALLGAQTDALLHTTEETAAWWQLLKDQGLKATLEEFRGDRQ